MSLTQRRAFLHSAAVATDDWQDYERRVGTTLCGKWTLERLLGVGGMAAVYVAQHKIGRKDAIKILHPDIAAMPDLRARFEQEARAVNLFRHPGAVEIRDIDVSEDGLPFLVMELLEGEALSAKTDAGVPLDEVLRIADEVLDVLAAAHASGIVHRDIKPDNLFVLRDGHIKVLDFGIARVRGPGPATGGENRTRTGTTLGTVSYMPPEQVLGAEIDGRADLFAVGATMFRLLAKRRIHDGETEVELVIKMATLPAPPLAEAAPGVPASVGHVVDRALAFDRSRRYPDATTMQGDVRALREGREPPYAMARLAAGDDPRLARPAAVGSAPPPSDGDVTRVEPARPAAPAPATAALPLISAAATPAPISDVRAPVSHGGGVISTGTRDQGDPWRTNPLLLVLIGVGVITLLLVSWLAIRSFSSDEKESVGVTSNDGAPKKKPADPATPTTAAKPADQPPPPPPPPAGGAPPPGHGSGKGKGGKGKD